MSACAQPIDGDRWLAYWAGELDAAGVDAIDEHMFGCETCVAEGERVARVVNALRTMIPPVITRADVEVLRARGNRIRETEFVPGVRTVVTFHRDADLMIHHLGGLQLDGAVRVDVVVRSESGGPIFQDPYAPFDVGRGEILIACQRHFESSPHDVAFDVSIHRAAGPPTVTTYLLPHEFA